MYRRAEIAVEMGASVKVMFNPNKYDLKTGVNYASTTVPGLDSPILQYVSGNTDTLTIELMFDTYQPPVYVPQQKKVVDIPDNDMEDVSRYTSQIYNLTKISGLLHRPPVCTFKWGSLQFKGVVTDVSQTFTMFLESGKPVRATVNVTFVSTLDPLLSKKASPWESPDRTKVRVIDDGTSLWQLAFDEYGDADRWKDIAKANAIRNPLDIKSGMEITLPPLKPGEEL